MILAVVEILQRFTANLTDKQYAKSNDFSKVKENLAHSGENF
jgi:hypothetical protein